MNPTKVLIVEDEFIVAENLVSKLSELGYSVIAVAQSGKETLEILSKNPVDVLLMDIRIKGDIDGVETASMIIEKYDIPIIYTTALSDEETFNRVKDDGNPYGFIKKPYKIEEIKSVIEVAKLRHAYDKKLSSSERRYKILVEETNDIIFSLNQDFKFISINSAVTKYLNIKPEEIIGTSLFEIVNLSHERNPAMDIILHDKLDQLKNGTRPVQFKILFNKKEYIADSPYEMNVRLEKFNATENIEIIGRAFPADEDPLMKYLVKISHTLHIENNILMVKDIVERITRELPRYIEETKIFYLKIALREIIINSIEHGNFGITSEEKTKALNNDSYIKLLLDKHNLPENQEKKVIIDYSIDETKAVYIITDQGNGFDFKETLKINDDLDIDKDNEYKFHGRGIVMALKIFDNLEFIKPGNQVKGVIYF